MEKNKDKYVSVFRKSFSLDENFDVEALSYQDIPSWDSVGHMSMIADLEEAFDIMLETEDIIDFGSFKKGIEILRKYNVEIE